MSVQLNYGEVFESPKYPSPGDDAQLCGNLFPYFLASPTRS